MHLSGNSLPFTERIVRNSSNVIIGAWDNLPHHAIAQLNYALPSPPMFNQRAECPPVMSETGGSRHDSGHVDAYAFDPFRDIGDQHLLRRKMTVDLPYCECGSRERTSWCRFLPGMLTARHHRSAALLPCDNIAAKSSPPSSAAAVRA